MCRSMVDIRSAAAEIRRGKKDRKKEERRKKLQGKNIMAPLLHRAAITNWMVIGDRMLMKFGNEQEHKKYAPNSAFRNQSQPLVAEWSKFAILYGCVEEILLFNSFFRLQIHALVTKIQLDKVVRWCPDGDFLHPVFSPSRVQHVSDLIIII